MNKITEISSSKIPQRTIERLCVYRRILKKMEEEGRETVSSYKIGQRVDILDTQVRKDLSLFGQFGIPGRGYRIGSLKRKIEKIIGKNRKWRICIVGVGNLGSALLGYPRFKEEGFEIVSAFDSDLRKVGKNVSGVTVEDVRNLKEVVKRNKIHIGIITVPQDSAQEVADKLVEAGIKAILNYAPCRLEVLEDVKALNVDFCLRLEVLTQFLTAKGVR